MVDTGPTAHGERPPLVRSAMPARRGAARPAEDAASDRPVAEVALDVQLAHLDRPFDYLVPESMCETAVPGARVKVRFAGREVGGFVLDRRDRSDHEGALSPLLRVVSAEPVLSPAMADVARRVADHYAGSLADVLRLAVPPRHARVEQAAVQPTGVPPGAIVGQPRAPAPPAGAAWAAYESGPDLVAALSRGGAPIAVWSSMPGADPGTGRWPRWPAEIADLVRVTVAHRRGALVVVPDHRDVDLVADALDLAGGSSIRLTADLGPAERYRRWLAIRRGPPAAVVGTRASAFAPVRDLGLIVVWDDGDDLHKEPRAPYPHTREIALLRSRVEGAAVVIGGLAVTAEGAELVRSRRARPVHPVRERLRSAAPTVDLPSADDPDPHPFARGRIPPQAFDVVRIGLRTGPVLVQVPRAGYVPTLACARCRTPARCVVCTGPLAVAEKGTRPHCRWCATGAITWQCPVCSATSLRAPVVGSGRTAEELGRAFPGVPVITSGGDRVRATVGEQPALVVSTTGAEPIATRGYAAAVLLDGWLLLDRADLRAGEESVRRWLAAAALVRPLSEGGRVVLVAPVGSRPVQAVVRWDALGHAERELADRTAAGLPPAVRLASVRGQPAAVADVLASVRQQVDLDVLGPVDLADGSVRALVRATLTSGGNLARALHAAQSVRSARKAPGSARVELDPLDLA